MAESTQEPTLGEVYRLCLDIRELARKTNGRVDALEKDAVRIKTIWATGVFALGFGADWIKHKLFGG